MIPIPRKSGFNFTFLTFIITSSLEDDSSLDSSSFNKSRNSLSSELFEKPEAPEHDGISSENELESSRSSSNILSSGTVDRVHRDEAGLMSRSSMLLWLPWLSLSVGFVISCSVETIKFTVNHYHDYCLSLRMHADNEVNGTYQIGCMHFAVIISGYNFHEDMLRQAIIMIIENIFTKLGQFFKTEEGPKFCIAMLRGNSSQR